MQIECSAAPTAVQAKNADLPPALEREFAAAVASMTRSDYRLLVEAGVPPLLMSIFAMVGRARIAVGGDGLYYPDPDGGVAYITPARIDHPIGHEALYPGSYVRMGAIIDLVAWNPQQPQKFARRTGNAEVLGLVRPQDFPDTPPTRIWRGPLAWLRADCEGLVLLEPDAVYLTLSGLHAGIVAEDKEHAQQIRQALESPTAKPKVTVAQRARESRHAR